MKDLPVLPFDAETKPKLDSRIKPAQDLLQLVQMAFSVVLGLSTLVLLTGFIIVNSYLGRVTDIHGYNISTGQYFAAGVGFYFFTFLATVVFVFAISLLARLFPTFRLAVILMMLAMSIDFILNRANIFSVSKMMLRTVVQGLAPRSYGVGPTPIHISHKNRVLLIVTSSIVASFLYGTSVYGHIPRSIGGGYPATIVIVLKEGYSAASFVLSPDNSNPNHTKPLWLLAELTDGLLVADLNTKHIVAVKNEAIVSIIDDQLAESLPDPTPTYTPSPTNTPTATLTATYTPTVTATP